MLHNEAEQPRQEKSRRIQVGLVEVCPRSPKHAQTQANLKQNGYVTGQTKASGPKDESQARGSHLNSVTMSDYERVSKSGRAHEIETAGRGNGYRGGEVISCI